MNDFQKEINNLKEKTLTMCTYTEESVKKAVDAVENKSNNMAFNIITSDERIDKIELEIEEECLKILALRHPVAADLRFILTVLRINHELERIGDMAVNIAKCAGDLSKQNIVRSDYNFTVMMQKVRFMLKTSLDSFVEPNIEKAFMVLNYDNSVDMLHKNIVEKIKEKIKEYPKDVDTLLNFVYISTYLERIGDLSTNIAEDVIYLVKGRTVKHKNTLEI